MKDKNTVELVSVNFTIPVSRHTIEKARRDVSRLVTYAKRLGIKNYVIEETDGDPRR